MDDAEAPALLDTLFAYQTAPGNTYRHKWSLGDFVMWDNRSVNHQACGGYAIDDIRLLRRKGASRSPDSVGKPKEYPPKDPMRRND